MDAALLAADDQLREHRGHAAVARGVADPHLVRVVVGRVDDELLRLRVVGGRRAQVLDVGAVAVLGHREAARELERGDVGQVALVVALRAEVQHGAAEEAELHADLHEQREVAEAERLEAGDVAAEVVVRRRTRAGSRRRSRRGRRARGPTRAPGRGAPRAADRAPGALPSWESQSRTRSRTAACGPSRKRCSSAAAQWRGRPWLILTRSRVGARHAIDPARPRQRLHPRGGRAPPRVPRRADRRRARARLLVLVRPRARAGQRRALHRRRPGADRRRRAAARRRRARPGRVLRAAGDRRGDAGRLLQPRHEAAARGRRREDDDPRRPHAARAGVPVRERPRGARLRALARRTASTRSPRRRRRPRSRAG